MNASQLILDIKEKDVEPPKFPSVSSGSTGFPQPKKRSRFKEQAKAQAASVSPDVKPPASNPTASSFVASSSAGFSAEERRRIDQENNARIASMSAEEIAEAQQELLSGMDPSILQMFLRRANLDEPSGPSPFDQASQAPAASSQAGEPLKDDKTQDDLRSPESSLPSDTPASSENPREKRSKRVTFDEDAAPVKPDPQRFFAMSSEPVAGPAGDAPQTTHFPSAPAPPDLDPSDPDFLANLHAKYFPNLPADPAKLAWMAPIPTEESPADRDSPYHPSQSSLPVSALRFDFRGRLLPPRVSRSVPMSAGLHHHAEAPEAAGYTIPELARLARSAVPAQRCLAFQTLGRVLYRLGRGEWGRGAGGRVGEEDDLAFGLWRLFRQGRVIESLEDAASVDEGAGHRSVRAYAIEALWLLEKGGWKERWRGL
jgi:hypothetical protein